LPFQIRPLIVRRHAGIGKNTPVCQSHALPIQLLPRQIVTTLPTRASFWDKPALSLPPPLRHHPHPKRLSRYLDGYQPLHDAHG
jgi:hypothetical protein